LYFAALLGSETQDTAERLPLLSDGSEGAPLELRDLFKQFFDELAPRA